MTHFALSATYRLQLSASFTLHDARARVPYLQRLGVSHLYLSPVLAARRGSERHGRMHERFVVAILVGRAELQMIVEKQLKAALAARDDDPLIGR